MIRTISLLALLFTSFFASAQSPTHDSAQVATILGKILLHCREVSGEHPEIPKTGVFANAAMYMAYRDEKDPVRRWKDVVHYQDPEEQESVDEICNHLNRTINEDSYFQALRFRQERKSDAIWHALTVSYKLKNGRRQTATFEFLFVNGGFRLADIDWSGK